MKKFLAILLAMLLALVSVAALAEEEPTTPTTSDDPLAQYVEDAKTSIQAGFKTEAKIVEINKAINKEVDTAADKTPAQTLSFTVGTGTVTEATTVTTAPAVTISDLKLAEGATSGKVQINLPEYLGVGVYTYPVTEVDKNVAGVVYAKNLELKVTVIQTEDGELQVAGIALRQGGQKTDEIENAYQAGSLEISKEVTGNMGDRDADWVFTVVFTAPSGDTVFSTIDVSGTGTAKEGETAIDKDKGIAPGDAGWTTKTVTVTLKHGENYKFDNLPAGVTYTVTETEDPNYTKTETFSNADKKIAAKQADTAAFENNRNIDIDTGISVETLPYVMIMALALVGAALLVVRRRREQF